MVIPWQIVIPFLLISNAANLILAKIMADRMKERIPVGIFYQALFCAISAAIFISITKESAAMWAIFAIAGIGFANAIGNYAQFHAMALSLSRIGLYLPLVNVLAVMLAVIFIGEFKYLTLSHAMGIVLCLASMYLFARVKGEGGEETNRKDWIVWVVLMIVIFGSSAFLLKWFSFVPPSVVLFAWFVGGTLGSFVIVKLKNERIKVNRQESIVIVPLSFTNIAALGLLVWAFQLNGPVSLVSTLQGWVFTIIPILAGWLLFGEAYDLWRCRFVFIMGLIEAFLILF